MWGICLHLFHFWKKDEKFADQIFSRVCQKNISAKVKRSVLRDGQSCIYEISGL